MDNETCERLRLVPLELMGSREIADLIGAQIGTVRQWHARGKLPEPVARLAAGPVWLRSQIEAWEAAR